MTKPAPMNGLELRTALRSQPGTEPASPLNLSSRPPMSRLRRGRLRARVHNPRREPPVLVPRRGCRTCRRVDDHPRAKGRRSSIGCPCPGAQIGASLRVTFRPRDKCLASLSTWLPAVSDLPSLGMNSRREERRDAFGSPAKGQRGGESLRVHDQKRVTGPTDPAQGQVGNQAPEIIRQLILRPLPSPRTPYALPKRPNQAANLRPRMTPR
jgi:hypothetical protein